MTLFDAYQVKALAGDLARVPATTLPQITVAVTTASKALKSGWQANAKVSAGRHGKRYPTTIDAKVTAAGIGVVEATVGPNPGRAQGGMSFEYGSSKQPPHLDGGRALTVVEPIFLSAVTAAAVTGIGL